MSTLRLASFTLLGLFLLIPQFSHAQALPAPVARMSDAADELPSMSTNSVISFTGYDNGKKVLTGSLKGSITSEEGEDADGEGKFSIKVQDAGSSTALKDAIGKKALSLALEFKVFPKEERVYLKFGALPSFGFFDEKKIQKKWMSIDTKGSMKEAATASQISAEDLLEALSVAHGKYPAFTFTERGSTTKEYVYEYRANPVLLVRMLNEADRLSGEEPAFSDEQAAQIGKMFSTVTGVIKINKQTGTLSSFTYKTTLREGEFSATIEGASTFRFNEKVSIKKPTGAVDMEQLFKSMSSGLFGESPSYESAKAKSYLSSVRVEAEIYYDSNYNSYDGVCNDSTIVDYMGRAGSSSECNEERDAYAIAAKLPSGKYYCVDSTGTARETSKKLGAKAVCSK